METPCPLGARNETRIDALTTRLEDYVKSSLEVRKEILNKLDRPSWIVTIALSMLCSICGWLIQYSVNVKKEYNELLVKYVDQQKEVRHEQQN